MKKICIIFFLSIIISVTVFGSACGRLASSDFSADDYLRIHIRADSDADSDQAVKYLVRDELVSYLTPLVANYDSKAEAIRGVATHRSELQRRAEKVLTQNGFNYGARVELTTERFPTRIYGAYTLPAGEYTAVIVYLGSGAGDNWWCVVYPPLCFAAESGQNVLYRSKILEVIERWKNR